MQFNLKQAKSAFFDRKAVTDAIDAGTRKVLSKFGAYVRTRAKTSIRTRKKSSPPGQPPSSHAGDLKRLIFFAYDTEGKSLIVGPIPFRKGEAPRLLEHGGTTTVKTKSGSKVTRYRGNPFMAPAAKAELPGFENSLRGMIK